MRNYIDVLPDGRIRKIQFAELRQEIEPKYNDCHDALSEAYYQKKEFVWNGKNYGILDKDTFDKLHGLIFHKLSAHLNDENDKRKLYPQEKMNPKDEDGKYKIDNAKDKIKELNDQGIDLEI